MEPRWESLRDSWEQDGFVRFPSFMDEAALTSYEPYCLRVVEAWRARHADEPWIERTTNMAGLTDAAYHARPDDVLPLVQLITDERLFDVLKECGAREPVFHNSQFFFEQRAEEWDGPWHRDTQFDADGDEDERRRIASYTGAHFRVAFANDPWLEIVPGSHRRWDTPGERALRAAGEDALEPMPGARSLELERGDALLFHAWAIHRGRYRKQPRRSTLDLIYGWPGPCPFAEAPRDTVVRDGLLERVPERARSLFTRRAASS